jgi:hypothetical protein
MFTFFGEDAIEELFGTDPDVQFTSDDSDIESMHDHDLSEDNDGIVPINQLWYQ